MSPSWPWPFCVTYATYRPEGEIAASRTSPEFVNRRMLVCAKTDGSEGRKALNAKAMLTNTAAPKQIERSIRDREIPDTRIWRSATGSVDGSAAGSAGRV